MEIHESGEANHYTIIDGNNWVMSIQFNGEKTIQEQRGILKEMVKSKEMLDVLKKVKEWWDSDDIMNDHLPIEEVEKLIK